MENKISGIQFIKSAGITANKKTEQERCNEVLRCVSDYSFSIENKINHERLDKCIHLYKEERESLKSLDFLDKIISIYQPEQIKRVVAEPFYLDVEGVGIVSKSDLLLKIEQWSLQQKIAEKDNNLNDEAKEIQTNESQDTTL